MMPKDKPLYRCTIALSAIESQRMGRNRCNLPAEAVFILGGVKTLCPRCKKHVNERKLHGLTDDVGLTPEEAMAYEIHNA